MLTSINGDASTRAFLAGGGFDGAAHCTEEADVVSGKDRFNDPFRSRLMLGLKVVAATGAGADACTGADAGAGTGTDAGTGAGNGDVADTDASVGAGADTAAGIDDGTGTDTTAGTDAGTGTAAAADTDAGINASTGAGAGPAALVANIADEKGLAMIAGIG